MTDPHGTTTLAERPDPAPAADPARGGWRLRLVIALAVVATVAVLAVVTLSGGAEPVAPPVGPLAAPSAAPVAAPRATPAPPASGPVASSAPTRVRVPAIGADSSLVPVGLDARHRVAVPPASQPMQAAWYSRSPTPGAVGPAVVLGHVNGNGRDGIFADLSRVRPGQEVEVDREDGRTAVFTVYRVTTVPKTAFPTTEVYGNTPDAQIRLVTCGGTLDESQHSYLSNVIVFGTLTAVRPA
ncbi:class F sortase [Actinomycetospora sp. CA-101289]|uniref:class F sortase n=1 Tax=Actinomycetospora sp. CA-101289 TaxID=3239893 RepID=UPI003D99CE99